MKQLSRIHRRRLRFGLYLISFVVSAPLLVFLFVSAGQVRQMVLDAATRSLSSVRQNKKYTIERYFARIQKQLLEFAGAPRTKDAAERFVELEKELLQNRSSLSSTEQRRLEEFYEKEFAPELVRQSEGQVSFDAGAWVQELDGVSQVLQYLFLASNPHEMGTKYVQLSAEGDNIYSPFHGSIHPRLVEYQQRFGFFDIYLVAAETGRVMYSVFKEVDFGTSLKSGPLSESGLARAFRGALARNEAEGIAFVDFESYLPALHEPISFVAAPIVRGGQKVAVAIFQVPLDTLNLVMAESSGLGLKGESYLVGEDRLRRSDSVRDPVRHSVSRAFLHPSTEALQAESVTRALKGESGTVITQNPYGEEVLSAFSWLRIAQHDWAIISEQPLTNVLDPLDDDQLARWVALGLWVLTCICAVEFFVLRGVAFLVSRRGSLPPLRSPSGDPLSESGTTIDPTARL